MGANRIGILPTKEALTGQGVASLIGALRSPSADQGSPWHVAPFNYATKPRALMDAAADALEALPDMLEACRCALGHLTGNTDGDWDLGEDPTVLLRAAISKATISSVAGREVAAPPGVKSDSKGGH